MATHRALEPFSTIRSQLRRGPSVAAGDLVLTPVVLEERAAGATVRGCWLVAAKRPVAIIIAAPGGRRLVRLDQVAQCNSGHSIANNSASVRTHRKS